MARKSAVTALACLLFFVVARAEQPARPKPLLKDFLGINTFCERFRPELYRPTCHLVRNYHNYPWDVGDDSTTLPPFPMSTTRLSGSPEPIDWGKLYESWKQSGWDIDVSIKLQYMPAEKFKDVQRDAYQYGRAFAEFFGPSGEHKLVEAVEVGNEPAHWDAAFYKQVFQAMARGLRDGDPAIKVLPAAVQAGSPDKWAKPVDILADCGELYDALNVHKYALVEGWPYWSRSYPEDPAIDYLSTVQDVIDWRDEHAPDKEIWLTEFGYDASSKPQAEAGTFSKWMDVTDEQQAQWIVRSFLAFAAMDVDRAYLYWFDDDDTPSFHAASGITRNFEPKMSYWAMKHLYDALGDYRFSRVVHRETGNLHVQEYVHGERPEDVVWVLWRATDDRKKVDRTVQLPADPGKAERMAVTAAGPAEVPLVKDEAGGHKFELNGSPIYVWMTLKEAQGH